MAAAEKAFGEEGYAAASLRGIAQRAGVDPALVHHYFDGKAALFIEVLGLPRDFTVIQEEVRRSPGSEGEALDVALKPQPDELGRDERSAHEPFGIVGIAHHP